MKLLKILFGLILIWSLFAPAIARAADDNEFLIGLIPEENIFRQVMRHRPLEAYLTQKLGVKTRFTILSRYPHIIKRFKSRHLDGAFFGILTAVLAEEDLHVEPIARPVNIEGGDKARSVIFVRKDTGIKSVKDMRGKKAAFVDNVTATGYLYAIAYLRANGVNNIKSFFSDYYFTGSHDTTVYTVFAGRADIGAAKERILQEMREKDPILKDDIVVLARSGELPDNTLCVRSDLPAAFKKKLKETLLTMHLDPEGKKVLKQMEILKFEPASPKDFGPVRALARQAGVNLKKYNY
jgi:phosphonate transport system substrate-binding protein